MVPKAVTLFIIRKLEKFIKTDLLIELPGTLNDKTVSNHPIQNCHIIHRDINPHLHIFCLQLEWFGADEDEADKYHNWKKMRETCKKALEIMEKSNFDA